MVNTLSKQGGQRYGPSLTGAMGWLRSVGTTAAVIITNRLILVEGRLAMQVHGMIYMFLD